MLKIIPKRVDFPLRNFASISDPFGIESKKKNYCKNK
jgi:hypothetical protein